MWVVAIYANNEGSANEVFGPFDSLMAAERWRQGYISENAGSDTELADDLGTDMEVLKLQPPN